MTQENLLARYTILHELGRGAIGAVYAARDGTTGAVVALKTLDPALLAEPNAKLVELFLKNARSAARLRHRSIVRIFDAGEAGGTAYVAMELVEGESLRHMLEERPLSIARAIRIFDDIASALAYAHEEGMVHRGVKPSNILVSRSGVAKIGDFGTGQIGEAALPYMSPEQVRRDPVDHRSDLFSLGAVLYEMLTRRAPFAGGSPDAIRQNILRAQPPAPSKVNPLVPAALDAFVCSLLAGRPDERFADARAVLRELQRLEEGLGLGSGASASDDEPAASVPPARPEPELRDAGAFGIGIRPGASPGDAFQHRPLSDSEEFDYRRAMMERDSRRERPSGSRNAISALVLALAVIGIGVGGFMYYSSDSSKPAIAASRMPEAPAASIKEPAPAPVAEPQPSGTLLGLKMPAKPVAPEPDPLPQTETVVARAPELPRIKQPAAKVPQQQPRGTAQLILAVSPGGELYINDEHRGTTPPVTTFDLAPGMHRVEVRSGSRKPFVTYMTVEAGDVRRIRHDFNARPSSPPG